MFEFTEVKFEECVELLSGFAFKSERFTNNETDVALIKGENVSQGRILWEISKHWPVNEWNELEKYQLQENDVVVAMDRPWVPAGLKWAFIRKNDPKALLVQRVARLRSKSKQLDQAFLRFLVGSPNFESYIRPITTGVNVPHISGKQILDFKFLRPPINCQKQIASILSNYDDLVENNRRRIKILEKMARSLYREWFVYFRYPGHEGVPLVDSPLGRIPKGWQSKHLEEVAEVVDCLHAKKPNILDEGEHLFIQVPNIGEDGKLDLDKKFYISEEEYKKWISRIEVGPGDCVITNVGKVGAVSRIPAGVKAAIGRNMTAVRANKEIVTQTYLISWLLSPWYKKELFHNKDSGSIMDALNVKGIVRLQVIIPDKRTLNRYDELVSPVQTEIETLVQKNMVLKKTRDLLLPRLLSGRISLDEKGSAA